MYFLSVASQRALVSTITPAGLRELRGGVLPMMLCTEPGRGPQTLSCRSARHFWILNQRTDAENHRVPDWKDKLCLDFPGHSLPLSHAVGGRGRCPGEVARWLSSKSNPLEVANTGLRRAEMHASLAFVLDLHSFQENHDLCNYFLPRQ